MSKVQSGRKNTGESADSTCGAREPSSNVHEFKFQSLDAEALSLSDINESGIGGRSYSWFGTGSICRPENNPVVVAVRQS